ncbi:MAG TPA: ribosome biogenesis GTP-binding protein YihA/YsxC [Candidatus Kapabacteria bacterium]|nr:ribosome biogenesis GTP-binding protein YihA/YsxC [Candidatus Kapabacteria bacterium]
MKITSATFITSVGEFKKLPEETLPEIAFVGRSNVGKSSLLNSLTGTRIAKTSSTPGKTRLINFFAINSANAQFYFVDLPGYGFAVGDKGERAAWERTVGGYVSQRSTLHGVIILLDSRHFILPNDEEAVLWIESLSKPYIIALTKADKLKQSERSKTAREAERYFSGRPLCRGCIMHSSQTTTGKKEIMQAIEILLGEYHGANIEDEHII